MPIPFANLMKKQYLNFAVSLERLHSTVVVQMNHLTEQHNMSFLSLFSDYFFNYVSAYTCLGNSYKRLGCIL